MKLMLAALFSAVLAGQNIRWKQIRSSDRQGDGTKGLSYAGASPTAGQCAVFDSAGNATGSGCAAASGLVLATSFSGTDIGEKTNNAFASFGSGVCGTVRIPSGSYTYTTPIYVPTGCILEGVGRGNDNAAYGTRLLYNGAGATTAITIMETNESAAYFAAVRDLSLRTMALECPNDGQLTWQAAAAGTNKWKCYDGASYTSPLPHLAGIRHGSLVVDSLVDGTNITIDNVDVNGGGNNGDINQQGGFHFGVYLHGCEECMVSNLYAFQTDVGLRIGEAANGVLVTNYTGRINRVAGLEYSGSNHTTVVTATLESNVWWGNSGADLAKYGQGIRASYDTTGYARNTIFHNIYFEGNDVDIYSNPGVPNPQSNSIKMYNTTNYSAVPVRGKWSRSRFDGLDSLPAANFTIRGGTYTFIGCRDCSNTPTLEADGGGNNPIVYYMDEIMGDWVKKLTVWDGGAFRDLIEQDLNEFNLTTTHRGRILIDPDNNSYAGLQIGTGTKPACDSGRRGMFWYVAGGAGVLDTFEVCRKDAADAYAWVSIF